MRMNVSTTNLIYQIHKEIRSIFILILILKLSKIAFLPTKNNPMHMLYFFSALIISRLVFVYSDETIIHVNCKTTKGDFLLEIDKG